MALSKLTVLNEKYVLRKVLGSNGPYDVTYLAWNLTKERNAVVIREYNPSFIVDRTQGRTNFEFKNEEDRRQFEYGLNCFVREAAAAALIDHPNVVKHEDYFRENGTSYCVSTFYPGATLSKVLEGNQSKIERRAAYAIIMPLLDGLLSGHRQGLIHGRLSPDQIFLTKSGRPMLFRFHVTRILLARRCGRVSDLNESGYTAPELLVPNGKKGPWSDIYSCGATLYSIITGNAPVDALDRLGKDPFLDILNDEKDISPGLKKLLYRAMSVDPEERPQSILEFKQELINVMDVSEREYRKDTQAHVEKPSTTFSLENAPALGKLSLEADTPSRVADLYSDRPTYSGNDRSPLYAPQKKEFSNGGDGFSSPAQIPFIDKEESSKAFVETNPLGPFANENMPVKSGVTENVVTASRVAFSRLEAERERIQLKGNSIGKMLPVLISVGAVLILSILWISGVFGGKDESGVVQADTMTRNSEVVSAASASEQSNPSFDEPAEAALVLADSLRADTLAVEPLPATVTRQPGAPVDSFTIGRLNIQRGDSLRLLRQFQQAALSYQNALAYLPGDAYADSMASVVEEEYRDLTSANLVRQYVRNGQKLIADENYPEAKKAFEEALRLRPGDTWVEQQLASLNVLIENADEDERRFQYLLAQGDGFFEAGNFETALLRYEEAQSIREDDEYVLEQIQRAGDSVQVAQSQEELRKNLYDNHIAKADSFLAGFEFEDAITHYQLALKQRPEDAYALDQVMSVQKKRLEQIDRLTDEKGVFEVTDVPPKLIDEAGLIKQIRYPIAAERANVEGRVILKMIVNEDGTPSEIDVLRGIGMGCDREAMRVLEQARFEPAVHQGETVRSWFTYTVLFKLIRE